MKGIQYLMRVLFSTLGNKRYLHDLEILLKDKLADLSGKDEETLLLLCRDIQELERKSHSKQRLY